MTTRKLRYLRLTIILLALLLIGAEASVLLYVRKYLPGGIAPVILLQEPNATITGLDDRDWIMFDSRILEFFRTELKSDIENIDDIPPGELITVLRDWSRKQALNLGIGIATQDPCRILDAMENGEKASCFPLALLYTSAANSMGINARRVDLFAYPGGFDRAHSTVEIWNGEKWVIQDPTFNSVAYGPDGEMLGAYEIQRNYESGTGVEWVQDLTVMKPDLYTYPVPPEELYRIVVYELREYPQSLPAWRLRLIRFGERLTGHTFSIFLTHEDFPIPELVLTGEIDRILLSAVLILLIMATLPYPARKR